MIVLHSNDHLGTIMRHKESWHDHICNWTATLPTKKQKYLYVFFSLYSSGRLRLISHLMFIRFCAELSMNWTKLCVAFNLFVGTDRNWAHRGGGPFRLDHIYSKPGLWLLRPIIVFHLGDLSNGRTVFDCLCVATIEI